MKVTQLPQQAVRYCHGTPSLSRRGGVRLHPIKDGTAPMGEQLTMLRRRDKLGNKLRDVINPNSGFCVGVTSPLEGPVNGKGTSGSHTVETRRAAVTRIPEKRVYVDEEGFVIRTIDMGDDRRPVAYVKPTAQPVKERPVRQPNGRNGKSRTGSATTGAPGATGAAGRITREDCLAYIKAASKGRKVVITDYLIQQARLVLKAKQKAAAKQLKIQG